MNDPHAPDFVRAGTAALAVGYQMPGVDYKPAVETTAEFIMSADLISAAAKVINSPKIQREVLANHRLNTRCFIYVPVTKDIDGNCKAVDVFVFTWAVGSFLVGTDLRFVQYFQNYDMQWCIPIYIIHDKTPSFHGGTIGQPWIPHEETLAHIAK